VNWIWIKSDKDDTVKIILVIAAAALLTGCREITYVDPPAPDTQASISDQRMCAEQAEKTFKTWPDQEHLGSTNHYNPIQKVCYLETTSRTHTGKVFDYGHEVVDAFEGREYASFMSSGDRVMACFVQPRGQGKIVCHSSDEFDSLVLQDFGTTQD
jgi:hypothetical protein